MKKILLISFLLLQFSIYAQNVSNWNIGLEFSTDNLSIDNGEYNDYLVTEGNVNGYGIEFDKSNYSLGITSKYFVNKKLSLSSGISYSNKDFSGTYSCATCDYIGEFPIYSPETIKQRFLVVPVSVEYTFLKGNLKPMIRAGFKNNIEIDNDLKEQSKGYFLEAFLGASIDYNILKSWNLGIGYNYQTALSDLYKTDDFNLRTNSFFLKINYDIK